MDAVTALGEQHQRFDVGGFDFAGSGKFLELFSHRLR
jgi:hypothetical protein